MSVHSIWDIDEKVEELLASPVGCAFLIVLNNSGVGAADAIRPAVSLQAAYLAVEGISIWAADFHELMKYALMHSQRLRSMARAILASGEHPEVGWWFAPIERDSQIWVSNESEPPTAAELAQPKAPMSNWERRTNKSEAGLYTCTSFNGRTSLFATLDLGAVHEANEISMGYSLPVKRWRLRCSESVRVYEINGAADWHRLCVDYPARSARDASDPEALDNEGWDVYPLIRLCGNGDGRDFAADMGRWLTPNWSAVAEDWDGVHLTLGGLLTAEKVRVVSAAGWSLHRFWDIEQTMWLRWAFDDVERLPDRDEAPLPIELDFPFADYWKFRDEQGKDYGEAIKGLRQLRLLECGSTGSRRTELR